MIEEINKLSKIDVVKLANYILDHYGPMSQLKLQKLVFYSDAYHLAYFERELIEDKFQAWMHGPVCVRLYHLVKEYSLLYTDVKYIGKDDTKKVMVSELTSSQFEYINDILSDLSKWSGTELEAATHNELPWMEARTGYAPADRCSVEISKKTTLEYYRDEINGQLQKT